MNPSTNFHVERLRSYSSKQILFRRPLPPRFVNTIPSVSDSFPGRDKHWHVKSAIAGTFLFCLVGGVLMVFAIAGGGIPILVFSGLFFGAGLLTMVSGFLKSRVA